MWMDAYGNWLALFTLAAIIVTQAAWLWRLTGKYHALQAQLGQADAKESQHKVLVAELRALIADEEDLDKCLRDEVDGKALARARDVEYEQNKAKYNTEHPESPWVPKENLK